MNYYVFNCLGEGVFEYLHGTNFVGVWENSLEAAHKKCRRHMSPGTQISYIPEAHLPKGAKVGYLY